MQGVPLHQTFYKACSIGGRWDGVRGVRVRSLHLFCEMSSTRAATVGLYADLFVTLGIGSLSQDSNEFRF